MAVASSPNSLGAAAATTSLPPTGIGVRGPDRPAAEEPHRPRGENRPVSLREIPGHLHPRAHVRGTPDHEGVIAGQVAGILHGPPLALLTGAGQPGTDALGDPLRGAVSTGIGDECCHRLVHILIREI